MVTKRAFDRAIELTESVKRAVEEDLEYLSERISKPGKKAGVEQWIDRLLSTTLKTFTAS
jgi:hypothetical protein